MQQCTKASRGQPCVVWKRLLSEAGAPRAFPAAAKLYQGLSTLRACKEALLEAMVARKRQFEVG